MLFQISQKTRKPEEMPKNITLEQELKFLRKRFKPNKKTNRNLQNVEPKDFERDARFKKAQEFEKQKRFAEAAQVYVDLIENYSKDKVELNFLAGRDYLNAALDISEIYEQAENLTLENKREILAIKYVNSDMAVDYLEEAKKYAKNPLLKEIWKLLSNAYRSKAVAGANLGVSKDYEKLMEMSQRYVQMWMEKN